MTEEAHAAHDQACVSDGSRRTTLHVGASTTRAGSTSSSRCSAAALVLGVPANPVAQAATVE